MGHILNAFLFIMNVSAWLQVILYDVSSNYVYTRISNKVASEKNDA